MSARQKKLSELEISPAGGGGARGKGFYIKWFGVSINSAVLGTGLYVG